jgi:YidC/Oxa1 family membrane protein insertase
MGKNLKRALGVAAILFGGILLTSCTASFCSQEDTARIMYTFDKGVTKYYDGNDTTKPASAVALNGFDNVYYTASFDNDSFLKDIVTQAISSKYYVPDLNYFEAFDSEARSIALKAAGYSDFTAVNYEKLGVALDLTNQNSSNTSNKYGFGYTRFLSVGSSVIYSGYDAINTILKEKLAANTGLNYSTPTSDFVTFYKKKMTEKTNAFRSCINTSNGYYGNYGTNGNESVYMSEKSWSYAWSKGFFEGLLVYPIAYIADYFTLSFAGGNAGLVQGWPQLLSIVFVTLIVRMIMFLCTIRTTFSQNKMQALQPELEKLQQKYPNAGQNQYEKQRLTEEQMRLYKKNGVKPFMQIIVLLLQFPVFICVWSALSGSAALATGSFLNLDLSQVVYVSLFNTKALPGNGTGWWTALLLFIFMSAIQFVSMKFPQWLNKSKTNKVKKLSKSTTAMDTNKSMKVMQYVMFAFIIIMGFTLPAAMGVYWIISAVFSIAQSLFVYYVGKRKKKEKQ